DLAALRQTLDELREERDALAANTAERSREVETQQAALAEVRATLERTCAEREQAKQSGLDAARRLADLRRHAENLAAQLRQRDALLQTARAELARLEEAARAADAAAAETAHERDSWRQQVEEAANRLERERLSYAEEKAALVRNFAARLEDKRQRASAAAESGERQPPGEPQPHTLYQKPLAIERSAPLGAVVETVPEPPAVRVLPERGRKTVVPSGELVLLDEGSLGDDACAALHGAGFEVTRLSPGTGTVDDLARRKLKCVMLNLGSGPAAWQVLRALRERAGTRTVPILAYVMTKETPQGFCFGRTDFAPWPTDSARIIERLSRLRPKLHRVLLLSADVDGMGSLREPLARAKVSTSIVLDAKQALEFAAMVEPEAALLHLSPACPSVTRAIAGLRTTEATRDLPLLVLFDKTPTPREPAFLRTVVPQLRGKSSFQFTNLPEEIARLIG
ncbi:MAG: hypothetical protein ACE5I7_11595, partial [Candidatus Binatia bacterium]